MCEQCGEIERRRAAMERVLTSPEFVAADERMAVLGRAMSEQAIADAGGDPDSDSIGVSGSVVRQAYAIALGVPLAELEKVMLVYAGDSVKALIERGGVDPVSAVEGAVVQGLAFGWHVRDEQLKRGGARSEAVDASSPAASGQSILAEAVERLNARSAAVMPVSDEIEWQSSDDVDRALDGLGIDVPEFKQRTSMAWALSICSAMGVVAEDVERLSEEQVRQVQLVMGGLTQALALGCVHEQVRAERDRG